ncbi:MAG: isoprenylcysteine carboxylmethyltransferase family protein [Methylocella sp.]
MSLSAIILALVTAQRVGELLLSRRNTARLVARGAIEIGKSHYPYLVAMHAAWLLTIWALGVGQPVQFFWLALFCCLQVLRAWVIATLAGRWTTRIIVLPGADLVKSGPYRFISHPNYIVVCAEIAVFPMVFGLPWVAVTFSILNALVLAVRITIENRALAANSSLFPSVRS